MRILSVLTAFLFVFLFCCILYRLGCLTIQSKRARTFIGTGLGRWGGTASFSYCNGFLRRVIRFNESREYTFTLKTEIRLGSVIVELENSRHETLLQLDENTSSGSVEVLSNEKYILSVYFQYATGKYLLKWK